MFFRRLPNLTVSALFVLLLAAPLCAQSGVRPRPTPKPDEEETESIFIEEVRIPVFAFDEKGNFDVHARRRRRARRRGRRAAAGQERAPHARERRAPARHRLGPRPHRARQHDERRGALRHPQPARGRRPRRRPVQRQGGHAARLDGRQSRSGAHRAVEARLGRGLEPLARDQARRRAALGAARRQPPPRHHHRRHRHGGLEGLRGRQAAPHRLADDAARHQLHGGRARGDEAAVVEELRPRSPARRRRAPTRRPSASTRRARPACAAPASTRTT